MAIGSECQLNNFIVCVLFLHLSYERPQRGGGERRERGGRKRRKKEEQEEKEKKVKRMERMEKEEDLDEGKKDDRNEDTDCLCVNVRLVDWGSNRSL